MSTDATALTATNYMGTRSGMRGEVTMFYRDKPGHEKQIRKEIEDFYANPVRTNIEDPRVFNAVAQTGVHDMRHVLFRIDDHG